MLLIAAILWFVERWWAQGRTGALATLPSFQDQVFIAVGRPMQVTASGCCCHKRTGQ